MRNLYILSFLVLVCVSSCLARDMIVGTSYGARLLSKQKAEYMPFPFKKRVKEVFYSDPSQTIIKGVIARDLEHTKASAIITAGGPGFTYATVRLKSERGSGLNYQIEIYA